MDYRFLIGEQFVAEGDTYRVKALCKINDKLVVRASSIRDAAGRMRLFLMSQVLRGLVTEEHIEIELPNCTLSRYATVQA